MERTLKNLEILYKNGIIDFEEYKETVDEYKGHKTAIKRIEESVQNHISAFVYTRMSENEYKRTKERLERSKTKNRMDDHLKMIIRKGRLLKAFEDGNISDDDFKRLYKNIK